MAKIMHFQCRGPGVHSFSGQRTRSHMPQLRVHIPQQRMKTLRAATKTRHSQIKFVFFLKISDYATEMEDPMYSN